MAQKLSWLPNRYEIRISGFGGQGIKLAGITLSRAIAHDRKFVAQTESYGPEARGGACKSDIVISDTDIDYPFVRTPDVLITMSLEALRRYINSLKPYGSLIYDSHLIKARIDRQDIDIRPVPATSIAKNLGNKIAANMIMLGALLQLTGIVSKETMEKDILNGMCSQVAGLNIRAFREGTDFIKSKETGE